MNAQPQASSPKRQAGRAGSSLAAWGLLLVAAILTGCSSFGGAPGDYRAEGKASYYGKAHHGNKTASGERFDQNALTAAHRTLPFGTRVKVTNLNNNRSVVLRINDRGPFTRGRIIDVSYKAAEALGMLRAGVAPVRVESL
ncbi:septal ring lytic transglycosylase RlpA family protein [Phytopseudomonas dryadis]|uniref:Endolytic peptidoglycan transglycosylase RlpA n=1 Tax=Phytopseudomonas dryadis TaxID=2487520 RepID=A0A4Q9QXI0_9GAMM|nr:septal ring lytic transglycosylase RlpA family protein [Pseudomonas dryadis]TBU89499.1 septal ring lytic transglycosylase RlpA family lipoprotein [Pseudomonas dryadis]